MIIELLIIGIGAGGSALIMLMGFLWRWRYLVTATAIALIVVWPQPTGSATSQAPTLTIVTWGESDAYTDEIPGIPVAPSHIVFAQVEVTAGDTALSVPALGTPSPANLLWIEVDAAQHEPLTDQARRTDSGTLWLPSHTAELAVDFQSEPLLYPDAACSELHPHDKCTVTLVWDLTNHGSVPIYRLMLLTSPAFPTDPNAALAQATWPHASTGVLACQSPISSWCTTEPDSP